MEERVEQATKFCQLAQEALSKVVNWTSPDQFKVGAKVWLEGSNLALPYQTCKLAPKHHGPFIITKQVSPVMYKLQTPPTWTIHDVFHTSLLTPYYETEQRGTNYLWPPPELMDREEEFEVENILRHCHLVEGTNSNISSNGKDIPPLTVRGSPWNRCSHPPRSILITESIPWSNPGLIKGTRVPH